MEDIDIENLDFDAYNREIYEERGSRKESGDGINYSSHLDALKKFKKEINEFVKEYYDKNNFFEENKANERRCLKY